MSIDRIHAGVLQPWIEARRREKKATGTINHGLKIVRRILNLATSEWVDEHGLTWLLSAPKIKLLPDTGKRAPYPLSWVEQRQLFRELPDYLAQMALSPSIQGAGMGRFAACAGIGKSGSRNLGPRSSSSHVPE
jgi:hypothetical protein